MATHSRRRRTKTTPLSSLEVARSVSLTYTTDTMPGYRRRSRGKTFIYVDAQGQRITSSDELTRIRGLVIPPAWTDVWICANPDGHLQVTGRDARRRKQYRYHPAWRSVRDAHKYDRLIEFAAVLPAIRRQVARHLRLPGMPREKVVALIVRLLEVTLIRIGNEEYARQNGSFGLTTLKDQHAVVRRDQVRFSFRGKSGRLHEVALQDARLARLVHQCRELPGYRLFQYLDEHGVPQEVGSGQVNEYLRTVTGREFTAKDFRTWFGTVIAAQELLAQPPAASQRARKAAVVRAIQRTAERLGNTVAVCRKCYIHPAVTNAYLQGALGGFFRDVHPRRSRSWWESATLRFLTRKGPEFRQAS